MKLPDGSVLDLRRSRWDGVLRPREVRGCREMGIPLAYDCVQLGWIPAMLPDSEEAVPRGDEGVADPDGGGRRIDVDAAGIEQRGERERSAFREEISEARTDAVGGLRGDALRRVEARADERVRAVAKAFDVRAAERVHWVLRAELARALRGGEAESPGPHAPDPAPDRAPDPAPDREGEAAFSFRPWTTEDVPVYLRLLANPRVWEYLPEAYPDPLTEETARTLIEVGAFGFHHLPLAVEHEGEPVGQCRLRFDAPLAGVRAAEVAYWLGEAYWGRGYMSRILPRFTEHAFRARDVDVIYAWIHRDHEASRRVAERSGYRRDTFPFETEVARRLGRRDFIRFVTFGADWR